MGSHTRVLSRLKPRQARVMSADWNSTNEASTSGIRSARVKPSTSRALTTWMKAARFTLTVSFSTVTVPPLAGQGGHQLGVGDPVGLHPGVGEGVTLDDVGDLGAGEALEAVGDRPRQGLELGGQPRGHAPLRQGVHHLGGQLLDVDVAEHLGGDLVGDGLLDRRVVGQGVTVAT